MNGPSTANDALATALPAGSAIGPHRVERILGAGAAGTVYAATEAASGRRVALKVLHRVLAGDQVALARLRREAEAVGQVRHPAIVEVLAAGALDDGRPYLVMPLLEGRSLHEELEESGRLA